MINLPTMLAEVQQLITDQVQENIHLDYKDSRALVNGNNMNSTEIAKDVSVLDVSAFANSDGGILLYGMQESDHLPVKVDDGVEHSKITRERIEQVINSNITPRVDDVRIVQIPVSGDKSIYVVQVPKSYRAPHQELNTKRYFKRFNFLSESMGDYEINDIRARRRIIPPLVNVDEEFRYVTFVYLRISNIGDMPAQDVTFEFSEKLVWHNNEPAPRLLSTGVKYLPPGKTFYFFYHTFQELLAEGSTIPSHFDVTVSYLHSEVGRRISDVFHIDLRDHLNSSAVHSDISKLGEIIKKSLDELTKQVAGLNKHLERLSTIAGATGLNLSVSTLCNVRHVLANEDQIEKINPVGCGLQVFREVLGIDIMMASKLQNFFRNLSILQDEQKLSSEPKRRLVEIEGMTEELAEKVRQHFLWEDDI